MFVAVTTRRYTVGCQPTAGLDASSMSFRHARESFALVLLLWAADVAATPPTGHLTGTVSNALDAPLPDATITVSGTVSAIARTDFDGRFDVGGLPEGDYEVVATLPGFAPARRPAACSSAARHGLVPHRDRHSACA